MSGQMQIDWQRIADAGGAEPWIRGELARRDLLDDDLDPGSLSGKALARFKSRRDQERRVRRELRREVWRAYRQAHLSHLGADVFYHDTDDIDRYDLPDPESRRDENRLPPLRDAAALAAALRLSIRQLRWLCYQRDVDNGSHYVYWRVPKRSGGERLISAPKPLLKETQRWILREIVEHLPVHAAAHGFLAGRSIVSNARVHAGAEMLVKFDIRDFYPSITWRRARGVFRKAGYGEQVATLLALLCSESPREALELDGGVRHVALGPRALPQGAPTSPALSNTLCLRLDCRLSGLAARLGFRYSRYADDLSFSWRPTDRTVGGAAGADGSEAARPALGLLLRAVHGIVREEGFAPNPRKTRVLRRGRRQSVTGLVVNAGPDAAGGPVAPVRVPRALRRRLRAALHNRLQGRTESGRGETLEQLRGWVAYLQMVDPRQAEPLRERLRRLQAR